MSLRILMHKAKHLSTIGYDMRRAYANFAHERFRAWKLIKLGNTLPSK